MTMSNRYTYVKFDEGNQMVLDNFREMVVTLDAEISALDKSRYQSLTLTKLEECFMYIGKAMRDIQLEDNKKADDAKFAELPTYELQYLKKHENEGEYYTLELCRYKAPEQFNDAIRHIRKCFGVSGILLMGHKGTELRFATANYDLLVKIEALLISEGLLSK